MNVATSKIIQISQSIFLYCKYIQINFQSKFGLLIKNFKLQY